MIKANFFDDFNKGVDSYKTYYTHYLCVHTLHIWMLSNQIRDELNELQMDL